MFAYTLGGIPLEVKGVRAKKFRPTADARHVFNEGFDSMQSLAHTVEEKLALESYDSSMMHAKFVCDKDEAVCKVLKALNWNVLKVVPTQTKYESRTNPDPSGQMCRILHIY